MNSDARAYIVEFIGPFTLTFIGIASIILTGDIVAIALAHGLAIGLMVAAAGHISGGHFNPAVTIGLLTAGKIAPRKAAGYIVAQLLGGIVAALFALLALRATQGTAIAATHLGVPALAAGVNPLRGTAVEIVLTFFLMFVIYGTAVARGGPRSIAPLAIGLTITMDVVGFGPLTGAAMNPSRAFGPALVGGFWIDQWVYWVGPIVGAILAAQLYSRVLESEPVEQPATAKG
ncbi:MAG: aquaporin [Chloroflexi bacterium]|nr:aquaporin [Chloroflexota bacterium]